MREEDAVEAIYVKLFALLEARDFAAMDDVLLTLNVEGQFSSVLLSVLTFTAMSNVRPRLSARDAFYHRVKECLVGRVGGEMADRLLVGLK